jgi:hypothetical protein
MGDLWHTFELHCFIRLPRNDLTSFVCVLTTDMSGRNGSLLIAWNRVLDEIETYTPKEILCKYITRLRTQFQIRKEQYMERRPRDITSNLLNGNASPPFVSFCLLLISHLY